jgi:hypothetical protein
MAFVPHVFFIPCLAVLLQESAQFVLKCHFPMMLRLPVNVAGDGIQIGDADGKTRIAALPCKFGQWRGRAILRWWRCRLFLEPEIRSPLHFLDPFGLGDGPAQPCEDMHMIFYTADT